MNEAAARRLVALACRILAARGLSEDVLGHVSTRLDDGRIAVRCRGPEERGLLFTTDDDVRTADGLPNELPIHTEVYAARPDVRAVVHAHPPRVVAADLAGVPLVPLVGAYNIPAARLAAGGIPVYERGVLVNTPELGREMVEAMADRPVCVLRGHGVTTVGATVEEAVVNALALDSLAGMALAIAQAGGTPRALPQADLDQLPDLGGGFNTTLLWNHHVARLEHEGLGPPG